MTDDELRARVAAERQAQGLPPKVTDPVVLRNVAAIFAGAERTKIIKRARRSSPATPRSGERPAEPG